MSVLCNPASLVSEAKCFSCIKQLRPILAQLSVEWINGCDGPAPNPPNSTGFTYNPAGPSWDFTITSNEPLNIPHRFRIEMNHGMGFVFYGLFFGSPVTVSFSTADSGKAIRFYELGNEIDYCGRSLGLGTTLPPPPPASGAPLTVDTTLITVDSTLITSDRTIW